MRYTLALALTLAVEVPIVVLALSTARLARGWRLVVGAVLVNLVTHPLVWLALTRAGDAYWTVFALVESAAVLVEAALFLAGIRRSAGIIALTSLAANLASILAGLALLD